MTQPHSPIEEQINAIQMILHSGYIHQLWPHLEGAVASLRAYVQAERNIETLIVENARLRNALRSIKTARYASTGFSFEHVVEEMEKRASDVLAMTTENVGQTATGDK